MIVIDCWKPEQCRILLFPGTLVSIVSVLKKLHIQSLLLFIQGEVKQL